MEALARCGAKLALMLLLLLQFSRSTDGASVDSKAFVEILPHGEVQSKPVGTSIIMTCKPRVTDTKLISDIQWIDPHNHRIDSLNKSPGLSKPPMYTELNSDNSLSLFFNSLKEEQAGKYICKAQYANTQLLSTTVTIETIVAITWDNAPENQFPILGEDFAIMCQVRARPSPTVDWLYNGEVIRTNDHYIIETHALRIKNVKESDDGVYTCRASVLDTGELKEKNIRVEVHTKPSIEESEDQIIPLIEDSSATIQCKGKGKPPPKMSWIKTLTKKNLAQADRFSVNEDTGELTITGVKREDDGEYQCTASNAAGIANMNIQVNVIVKPKIMEFVNQTSAQGQKALLGCKAFGKPPPKITFRKQSNEKSFVVGLQPDDDRIILTNQANEQSGETVGELKIDHAFRSDDGLYECIASNDGGSVYSNGHLLVEFPPSFASMSNRSIYSWDTRPVNLTCIAESIPNATIVWTYYGEQKIENDPQIKIYDQGAISVLQVRPMDRRYYTVYTCTASNKHGRNSHQIELREAQRPADIPQVNMIETTATTITFSIVPPVAPEDFPIQTISVQYREQDTSWNTALNRTWSVDPKYSRYVVENLKPETNYDFRFAAANMAGRGNWAMNKRFSTTVKNVPGYVRFLSTVVGDHVRSLYHDRFNVKWSAATDNGERIDYYEIKWCEIKKYSGDQWVLQDSNCQVKTETKQESWLTELYPDTYYKIEVKAHNALGWGLPTNLTVKTARETEGFVVDGQITSDGVTIQLALNVVAATLMILSVVI